MGIKCAVYVYFFAVAFLVRVFIFLILKRKKNEFWLTHTALIFFYLKQYAVESMKYDPEETVKIVTEHVEPLPAREP